MGSLWAPYGLPLGFPVCPLWGPYGVAMPPSPRRVTYVYYEQYLTVVAEGLWGPYGVPCMSPMGSLWDVPYGMSPMGSQCSRTPAG